MIEFFKLTVYQPLYNLLVFLIEVIPGGDVGIAVIVLTVFVKMVLFPLSLQTIQNQIKMREIQKPLEDIKLKYKDNREEQARQMMKLYSDNKLNPFSGLLNLFIQIPVVISLYYVFIQALPNIDKTLLYSFIPFPDALNMNFLGLVDLSQKHIAWIALIVALTQYFQAVYAIPKVQKSQNAAPSFQEEFARSMSLQARYVFPIIIFFVAYNFIAAISVYWIVSNLFAIGQEIYVRKKYKTPPTNTTGSGEIVKQAPPTLNVPHTQIS